MNFTSQICTTKEQSEKLLALGLKKETADCIWCEVRTLSKDNPIQWRLLPEYIDKYDEKHIPAWSLHRLIEILGISKMFFNMDFYDSPYEEIIRRIDVFIHTGVFNREYLEE